MMIISQWDMRYLQEVGIIPTAPFTYLDLIQETINKTADGVNTSAISLRCLPNLRLTASTTG